MTPAQAGQSAPPSLVPSDASFDFGSVRVGQSVDRQFTITNPGSSATAVLTLVFVGVVVGDQVFSIAPATAGAGYQGP